MARLRLQLEGGLQFLLGAVVVWIGFAASSLHPLNIPIARAVRWGALGELFVFALAYAVTARGRYRPPPSVLLAAAFAATALLSAAWSADPRLSFGRGVTFTVLLVTGVALGAGARTGSAGVRPFLFGLLAGAAFIAVAGLVKLAADPDTAIVPATTGQGARYNGIGGNPDTMAVLFAVLLPLAVWVAYEARARWEQLTAAVVLLLLDGSLAASGSRGALVGGLVGVGVVVVALPLGARARRILLAAAVAVFLIDLAVAALPPRAEHNPPLYTQFGRTPVLGPHDAQPLLPLSDEFDFPRRVPPGQHRTLFDAGGRLPAWRGAVKQAAQRPLLGYGFGMEERVFVDRYYPFLSDRPENSYIGVLLQLGIAGLVLLLALFVQLGREAVRVLPRLAPDGRSSAAACLGVAAAGIVVGLAQSYLTSVGSPATAPFWICAFLLTSLAPSARDAAR